MQSVLRNVAVSFHVRYLLVYDKRLHEDVGINFRVYGSKQSHKQIKKRVVTGQKCKNKHASELAEKEWITSGLTIKQTPWPWSASELYRPTKSDRRLSAKLVPTFADRGCRVVSATDPYGRILGSLY
jgi:hypothetical protein